MQQEELRNLVAPNAEIRHFHALLIFQQKMGLITIDAGLVRLSGFQVELNDRQIALMDRIEEFYVERGLLVPTLMEVSSMARAPVDAVAALLKMGVAKGKFAFVSDGTYYANRTLIEIKTMISQWLMSHDAISVGEFRDLTTSNRKSAMQALEYLDSTGFTQRIGDVRRIDVRPVA